MRKSNFTEEKIIAFLAEQERGTSTADVCHRHGVSSATFYKWKAKFGGMDVSDAGRRFNQANLYPAYHFQPATCDPETGQIFLTDAMQRIAPNCMSFEI